MSLGSWLDAGRDAIAHAVLLTNRHGLPAADQLAVLHARDRGWSQVARLAELVRGAPLPGPVSLSRALRELDDQANSAARTLIFGARGATFGLPANAGALAPARSAAARSLADGVDHLRTAGDLLASHIDLRLRDHGFRPPVSPTVRTRHHHTYAGAAVAAGVERDQSVGELARIAQALLAFDRAIAGVDAPHFPYLVGPLGRDLHRWAVSRYGQFFTEFGQRPAATLVRQMQVATGADRAAGPRPIQSIGDVQRSVDDLSTAVHRAPHLATVRLIGQIARLGYVCTVLASRAAGEQEPSTAIMRQAQAWKQLAHALTKVRDIRDGEQPVHAAETHHSADWLREHARARGGEIAVTDVAHLQQMLARISGQAIDPLRHALVDRQLLTSASTPDLDRRHGGILIAEAKWEPAAPNDGDARAVLHRLGDVVSAYLDSNQPGTPQGWPMMATTPDPIRSRQAAAAGNGPAARRLRQRREQLQQAVAALQVAHSHDETAAASRASLLRLPASAGDAARMEMERQEAIVRRAEQAAEIAGMASAENARAAGLTEDQEPTTALVDLQQQWSVLSQAAVRQDIATAETLARITPTANEPNRAAEGFSDGAESDGFVPRRLREVGRTMEGPDLH